MTFRGHIDHLSHFFFDGWVYDPKRPESRLNLLVTANDELVGRTRANLVRADLAAARIGDGRYGFRLTFDTPLSPLKPLVIRVRREDDGADIPGSPAILSPPRAFDAATRKLFSDALARYGAQEEIEQKITFHVEEIALLQQLKADRDSSRDSRRRQADFLRRWRWRLAEGEAEPIAAGAAAKAGRRALVIDELTPKRGHDAGSNAVLSHMESLQRLGFEVAFAAADEFRPGARAGDGGDLDALGIAQFRPPWCASVEEAMLRQAGEFDLVYLHRPSNAARYLALARTHFPRARVVYSLADLHFLRLARQAATEDRPELARMIRATQQREFLAMASADVVITHSSFEADLLRRHLPKDRVHVVTWATPLRPTPKSFAERKGVAFIGYYGHQPNVDAARWLIDEIIPLARKTEPDIECLLVGAGLPESLAALCGDGCVAVGAVDDLASIFARVRLTVAPLAFGAGIKGKVLDSLAAGVPCVCTPIAAEGLDLPNPLRALVAADTAGLAAAILRVHADEQANDACRDAGLELIGEKFSQAEVDGAMRRAVEG